MCHGVWPQFEQLCSGILCPCCPCWHKLCGRYPLFSSAAHCFLQHEAASTQDLAACTFVCLLTGEQRALFFWTRAARQSLHHVCGLHCSMKAFVLGNGCTQAAGWLTGYAGAATPLVQHSEVPSMFLVQESRWCYLCVQKISTAPVRSTGHSFVHLQGDHIHIHTGSCSVSVAGCSIKVQAQARHVQTHLPASLGASASACAGGCGPNALGPVAEGGLGPC